MEILPRRHKNGNGYGNNYKFIKIDMEIIIIFIKIE